MNSIFEDLFVLELANNHNGDIHRGKKIIKDFSNAVSPKNIKTAIKLQFRDNANFIHENFNKETTNQYINKVLNTTMPPEGYRILTEEIKKNSHIAVATPFDEKSVETCLDLDIDIIKIASANIDDWHLVRKISDTKKPVIISTGGAKPEKTDEIVKFFEKKNIPLAINHCISIYPSLSQEMQLNQVDFLKNRYPTHTIGFSTHEYNDSLEASMLVAYAKGARLFERHIDLEDSPMKYCSTVYDILKWIDAHQKAQTLCGKTTREICKKETDYLQTFERGVYAKETIAKGQILTQNHVYFAIPKQEGQLSSKEFKAGAKAIQNISKDSSLNINNTELEQKNEITA